MVDRTSDNNTLGTASGIWLDRQLLRQQPKYFEVIVATAVKRRLTTLIGPSILDAINFHLQKLNNGADLSQIASRPELIEKGLNQFFWEGAKVLIRESILAAYREFGLIPDRQYISLNDAFSELFNKVSQPDYNNKSWLQF